MAWRWLYGKLETDTPIVWYLTVWRIPDRTENRRCSVKRIQEYILEIVQEKRETLGQWQEKRDQTLKIAEGVTEVKNIPYMEDGDPRHQMDVYYPVEYIGRLPVILNIHGGGLLMGDKSLNRYFCAQLASMGCLVFSAEYDLVPEVTVYRQFDEISRAMDRVYDLAETFDGDKERAYMIGDSAGAYLIIYAVAMQGSEKLAKAAGVCPSAFKVKALGLQSGMFYTRKADDIGLFLPKILYGKDYRKSDFEPYTNPEHEEILKNLPPCYLMTSQKDRLRRYTLQFVKALKRNGVPYALADYHSDKKLSHAFSVLFPELKESLQANERMVKFLLCKK